MRAGQCDGEGQYKGQVNMRGKDTVKEQDKYF